MKLMWRSLFFYSFLIASLVSLVPLASVKAQIEPDNTLGSENSQVVPDIVDGVDLINGGATRGSNLFHSFREFNIDEGRGAYFSNPQGIANIFSRVTGGNPSNILGVLGVIGGDANLFLINPNGIFFGRNASLNLRGSFFASTADSLVFDNNFEFSASNAAAPPLLTVNIPTGLRFRNNPGSITVQGFGHEGFNQNGELVGASGRFEYPTLEVAPGNILALVGGSVALDGGVLQAPGGRVELGGLATAGTVGLDDNFQLSFPTDVARADISLSNLAGVNVITDDFLVDGSININARNIRISELSLLTAGLAENLGTVDAQAGNITLNADGETRIDSSRIENNVNEGTIADNSNIIITSGSFILTNESELSASDFGFGELDIDNPRVAGDVRVNASGQITIDEGASIFSNGFFGRVLLTSANGSVNINNASIEVTGNNSIADDNRFSLIDIAAPQGSVFFDRAELSTTNEGTGYAGDIKINARDRVSVNNSRIESQGRFGRILIGKGREDFYQEITSSPREVSLNNSILSTTNNSVEEFQDTQINAGNISIDAIESISLANQSRITSSTGRLGNAGDIFLTTNGAVEFDNSRLFSNVNRGGVGRAGDINIKAGSLNLLNGAQLQSGINPGGQGNDISQVTIEIQRDVRIAGSSPTDELPSSIFTDVLTNELSETSGDASNITITSQTGSIYLEDGALLRSSNASDGLAGNIVLNARSNIEITNSEINSTSNYNIVDPDLFNVIEITAQEGSIFLNGARLEASNSSVGFAGDIILNARDRVSINNSTIETDGNFGRILIGKGREDFYPEQTTSPREVSLNNSILSTTNSSVNEFPDRQINAGDISIDALDNISLSNESEIQAFTQRFGNAGSVTLRADNGAISFENSNVFSTVEPEGEGQGGNITITAKSLSLLNSAQLQTIVRGSDETRFGGFGNAGDITIDVRDAVIVDGSSNGSPSQITSEVEFGAVGDGGDITIDARSLFLSATSELSATNTGNGAAGNITVRTAKDIRLDNEASINADTQGGQGNIDLRSRDLILRRQSNITTNARGDATGGNITINTGNLLAFPRENSDISANATEGFGGEVKIDAQGIFGIKSREQPTFESDITASSERGPEFSGTVDLNNPDVDPSRGLIELPENVVDPSTQIAQNPCQRGVGSEFTVTGRGGLPPSPDRTLSSDNVRVGLVAPVPSKANTATTNINSQSVNSNNKGIVPAQGWVFNDRGEVMLTAYDPTNKGVERSRQNSATCTAR